MQNPSPYPLIGEAATVILDGSGNGKARWTPGAAGAPGSGVGASRYGGYSVDVAGVAVSVAVKSPQASCSVYLSWGTQSATDSDFQSNTLAGSTGDTCSINQTLKPQDWITAAWAGGSPGALATMTITGTVNPPGVS